MQQETQFKWNLKMDGAPRTQTKLAWPAYLGQGDNKSTVLLTTSSYSFVFDN